MTLEMTKIDIANVLEKDNIYHEHLLHKLFKIIVKMQSICNLTSWSSVHISLLLIAAVQVSMGCGTWAVE